MITDDIVDILKVLMDKHPDEMSHDELRQNYEGLVNVMIGMMIGSRFTTGEIKKEVQKLLNERIRQNTKRT